jgi:hypothetical protein
MTLRKRKGIGNWSHSVENSFGRGCRRTGYVMNERRESLRVLRVASQIPIPGIRFASIIDVNDKSIAVNLQQQMRLELAFEWGTSDCIAHWRISMRFRYSGGLVNGELVRMVCPGSTVDKCHVDAEQTADCLMWALWRRRGPTVVSSWGWLLKYLSEFLMSVILWLRPIHWHYTSCLGFTASNKKCYGDCMKGVGRIGHYSLSPR